MRAHIAATSRPSTCAVRSPRRAVAPKPRAAAKGVRRVQPQEPMTSGLWDAASVASPSAVSSAPATRSPARKDLPFGTLSAVSAANSSTTLPGAARAPTTCMGGLHVAQARALDGLLHHSNAVAVRGNVGQALCAETARLLTESASGRGLRGQRREIKAPLEDMREAELHERAAFVGSERSLARDRT